MFRLLNSDEILVRPVLLHLYPDDGCHIGSCLVPATAHSTGKACTHCLRCDKMVNGDDWDTEECDGTPG